jgi:O-antigen/teichoic acid export membrane protein
MQVSETERKKSFQLLLEVHQEKTEGILDIIWKALKNLGFQSLGLLFNKFGYLLLYIFIARFLGPEELGKYTLAISFVALFSFVTDLGLNPYLVKTVTQDRTKTKKYLGNISVLRFFLSILGLLGVILSANLLHYAHSTTVIIYLFGVSGFFVAATQGYRWYFQAVKQMKYEALLNISFVAIIVPLSILMLFLKLGLVALSWVNLFAGLFIFSLTLVIFYKKFPRFKYEIDLNFWKSLLKSSLPYILMLIFLAICFNIDTVIISYLKGDKITGLYNAAKRITGSIKMIPGVFFPIWFPLLSEFFISSKERFLKMLEKLIVYLTLLFFPLGILVTFLADKIVFLLYGKEFLLSADALRFLIWSANFWMIGSICTSALISMNHIRKVTLLTFIAMILNLALNFALIPKLNQLGSSISLFLADLLVLCGSFFWLARKIDFVSRSFKSQLKKISVAGLVMAAIIFVAKELNLFLLVPLSLAIYFIILKALKFFPKADWDLFKRATIEGIQLKGIR